jgi:two-component system KDP operon response regulator KdpE
VGQVPPSIPYPRKPVPFAPNILVVDDDPAIRKLFRKVLEEFGYLVAKAGNGRQAMNALRDQFFDLTVLDLSMPDMDGIEVLQAIRRELPHIKIVVISGFMKGAMLSAASALGADAAIQKPLTPDEFLKTVCDVLADYFGPETPSS